MDRYYARICWNSNGWKFPTGDAPKLEHNTYAANTGFGHEEWLFNFLWKQPNGWHYAFLQPVSNSRRKITGKTINVLLWSINPGKQRVQVGEIKNCQVLADSDAQEALQYYRKQGWLKRMEEDVARVGGKVSELSSGGLFNIRFRPEHAIQYDDPLPIAKPTDKIARLNRYTLVDASQIIATDQWMQRVRKGSTTIPVAKRQFRPGTQCVMIDPYHPVLQAELMKLLQMQFGKNNVVRESGWVDITVTNGNSKLFIEIKTDPVAKRAIREALGQILEYAYLKSSVHTADAELFIVAPGVADEDLSSYLDLLRNKFQIPVQYCSFSHGSVLPDSLRQFK